MTSPFDRHFRTYLAHTAWTFPGVVPTMYLIKSSLIRGWFSLSTIFLYHVPLDPCEYTVRDPPLVSQKQARLMVNLLWCTRLSVTFLFHRWTEG
jgi:hypothetical protein